MRPRSGSAEDSRRRGENDGDCRQPPRLRRAPGGAIIHFAKPGPGQRLRLIGFNNHIRIRQAVQKFELRIVEEFIFSLLIEDAYVAGGAVEPNHLPAEPSGEGDDIFGAAQALRWFSIPKREHQPALVDGFDAAFVVALLARTVAGCNFNRGCLAQNLLGARPRGRVEVLAELFPRQRQQNAKRQLQLNAALGKQQVPSRRNRGNSVHNSRRRSFSPGEKVDDPFSAFVFVGERAVARKSDGHGGRQLDGRFH